MDWFNYCGLIFVVAIMIPNIIFAVKCNGEFTNKYKNKIVEILEQVGRYACMLLMVFNIPYTYFNFWFENALYVYLAINSALCLTYYVFWVVCWNKNSKVKALSLSIIPTAIFLSSGIILSNIPLIAFSVLFGVNHILLSYKNAGIQSKIA